MKNLWLIFSQLVKNHVMKGFLVMRTPAERVKPNFTVNVYVNNKLIPTNKLHNIVINSKDVTRILNDLADKNGIILGEEITNNKLKQFERTHIILRGNAG